MREFRYQMSLIVLLIVSAGLFGYFIYREVFPEYKIYQNTYLALEEFRAEQNNTSPPPFRGGIKQIVIAKADKGPETIDRCTSCHVALQLEHFSPTKPSYDINGNLLVNAKGEAVLEKNENYVWGMLDNQIASLKEENRLSEAKKLESLKSVEVGHNHYDMTKVIAMHPLIGGETRPFQYHSMDDLGCVSCHNGNGRSVETFRAHGPVFDGQYETESHGSVPEFLEPDPENDPQFAKVLNGKPGSHLLFQTSPLYVGGLIEANCVQCHQSTSTVLEGSVESLAELSARKQDEMDVVVQGIENERSALLVLLETKQAIKTKSYAAVLKAASDRLNQAGLLPEETSFAEGRWRYINNLRLDSEGKVFADADLNKESLLSIDNDLLALLGSEANVKALSSKTDFKAAVDSFFVEQRKNKSPDSSLYAKMETVERFNSVKRQLSSTDSSLERIVKNKEIVHGISGNLDNLLSSYERGSELFRSQACYACHRIAGYSRGGIGPELTMEGNTYPWFVKESIVWPQADLKTSTMPNFKLDHDEVEDLMAFIMAQKGESSAFAEVDYKIKIKEWEAGKKVSWEKPLAPEELRDLRAGMTTFANEGCASCHKLKGFESNVGFSIEKGKPSFDQLYQEKEWFTKLFPEDILGSQIVAAIDANQDTLDKRLSANVRSGSILEELDEENITAFYSNFKYALRAKNAETEKKIEANPTKRLVYEAEKKAWKERVQRVLKMYIQEYGLGRLIGPKVNWSGVFRTDEWLIAHFRNPSQHTAKSIMPVMPFDSSKFYQLTFMLDILGRQNTNADRQIWDHRGFNPETAYEMHCANCHGEYMDGNGPTAEWIYPIPKNLHNATFLRNLTKEKAIESIVQGVKGTPMPPWGLVAVGKQGEGVLPVLKESEIKQIVDWIYLSLPGERVIQSDEDVLKWQYTPEDVVEELQSEGIPLNSDEDDEMDLSALYLDGSMNELRAMLPSGEGYYVALEPKVYIDPNQSSKEISVKDLFAEKTETIDGVEKKAFYIKKKYFTEENIAEGQKLFVENCAICHGKEGAGNGDRSMTMEDAKPRMLSNLPWQETRDDLRLLRSIKYGVPGTSMTPWGDATSGLQRIQLLMFIRNLTEETHLRNQLESTIYESFETSQITIEVVRSIEQKKSKLVESNYETLRQQRESLYQDAVSGEAKGTVDPVQLYTEEFNLLKQLKDSKEVDSYLLDIMNSLAREKELYLDLGYRLIGQRFDSLSSQLDQVLTYNKLRYTQNNGKLILNAMGEANTKITALTNGMLAVLNQKKTKLEKKLSIVKGQLMSLERVETEKKLQGKLLSVNRVYSQVLATLKGAAKEQALQQELYMNYQTKNATLSQK
jgi:mono/diheme cytochrome c family protein